MPLSESLQLRVIRPAETSRISSISGEQRLAPVGLPCRHDGLGGAALGQFASATQKKPAVLMSEPSALEALMPSGMIP